MDPDLAAFYRSMLPDTMPVNKPRWPSHVTVVRAGKETPKLAGLIRYWGVYQGADVELTYDPFVRIDKTYYWLNVWCPDLVKVRKELGLPPKSRWTLPPSGGEQCFHLTIGNKK